MRIKILETQSGRRYAVSEKNELAQFRLDRPGYAALNFDFSGAWRLMGFAPILPFGRIGSPIPPDDMLDKNMRYQNRKGAYAVVDYDHGTYRIWGDRAVNFFEWEYEK